MALPLPSPMGSNKEAFDELLPSVAIRGPVPCGGAVLASGGTLVVCGGGGGSTDGVGSGIVSPNEAAIARASCSSSLIPAMLNPPDGFGSPPPAAADGISGC